MKLTMIYWAIALIVLALLTFSRRFKLFEFRGFAYWRGTYRTFGFWSALGQLSPLANTLRFWRQIYFRSAYVSLLLIGIVGLSGAGCVHFNGDPIVGRCEQTEAIAYSTFGTFLKIDNADRAFFKTNAPAMHQFAEYLRAPVTYGTNSVPRGTSYILSLDDVKLAYKHGKATSNDVMTALATVETAVSKSQQLISQAKGH